MNITQQQEFIKHNQTELSTCENLTGSDSERRTAFPPDWTESQHAESDSITFNDYIEDDFEALKERGFFSLSPVSNTGATTPLTPLPQKTKIDTLSLTFKDSIAIAKEILYQSLKPDFKDKSIGFNNLKRGSNGYKYGIALTINRREIAKIFYGCDFNKYQAEKPQIYIGGNGDTDYFDFVLMNAILNTIEDTTITRADIALDSFYGEITLEQVKEAYIQGKYKKTNAPRNPKWQPIGDRNPIDGTHYGITYQIGSRSSSDYLRHYLKGYEIFRKQLESFERTADDTLIKRLFEDEDHCGRITVEGYNNDKEFDIRKWLRTELEMKSKNNRKLPLDCIVNTDQYFAGAFPYLEEILVNVEGIRPKHLKKQDELELETRIQNMKNISGALIDDLIYLGWTNDEIVKVLRGGKGPSQKLIRSGLALRTPPGE